MPVLSQWLDAAAKDCGNQRALVHRDTYLSWRGLQHRVERRAQELTSMGIGPGAWVGLMLGNVADMVVLTVALDKIGAVSVPMDPATAAQDLEMMLDSAPLRALITRPATGTTSPLAPPAPGSRRATPLALRITDATRAATPRHKPEAKRRLTGTLLSVNFYKPSPAVVEMANPTMVAFTTDSGGDPKGVLRDDGQLSAIASSLGLALGARAGQVALLPTPFHYSSGFDAGLVVGLAHHLTMLLEDEFSARGLTRILKEDQADIILGTPAQYTAVCQSSTRLGPLKAQCVCVQSPGLAAAASAFHDKWQTSLLPLLHSAETGPVALDRSGVHSDEGFGAGVPLPGVSVRITAPDGTQLPGGVSGQIWLRSGAASAAAVPPLPRAIRQVGPVGVPIGRADREGWFRTGDLGFLEAETGRLLVSGREDDLVWVEGRRLSLGEVEGCLEAFALVKEAQARIVYDELVGPILVARVVPSRPCRVEDIIEHCARNLAPFKVPRQIEICAKL